MALTSDAAGAVREGAQRAAEGARSVLADFLEALRSAAYGILDEQKTRASKEVGDIAEAVRLSARSLEQSDNQAMARYVERAALGIQHVSDVMRDSSWNDILADTEAFAQRRPALFVFGAIAAGFTAGCLASVPTARRAPDESLETSAPLYRGAEMAPLPAASGDTEATRRADGGPAKQGP